MNDGKKKEKKEKRKHPRSINIRNTYNFFDIYIIVLLTLERRVPRAPYLPIRFSHQSTSIIYSKFIHISIRDTLSIRLETGLHRLRISVRPFNPSIARE